MGRRKVFQPDPFALARIKHGGPQPEFPEHPVRFPVTLVSLWRSFFHLPSSSAAPRGSAPRSVTADLLPAPTRGPAHQPASTNRRPRCAGWQRRPAPPLSLTVACGCRAGSAAFGRADWWCGTAGPGCSPPATAHPSAAEPVSPEPPPWTSRTVSRAFGWSPRRAGGRVAAPGVCLRSQDGRVGFVLRARRPPARRGPSARNRPVWGPAAPCRARPAPAAAGDLGVPCRPRCGEGRAQSTTASGLGPRTRAPDSPRPPCVEIAPTPPTPRGRAEGRVGPPLPRLAFAPQGGDPARPFSKSSTRLLLTRPIFRGSFTVDVSCLSLS